MSLELIEQVEPYGSQVMIKRKNVGAISSDIIILPDTAINFSSLVAEVIKVGTGEVLENGVKEPMPVNVGDTVLSWGGYGTIIHEDHYNIYSLVDISEIDGILENE